ncbi:YdeI/OmpD-associated family protein [Gallaecimonas sp. GXIMD4217]|uniref:YdeI/OmpD-associated family protein n=1 Tax=Gallaecimonas sp. GXIMD4217 TaxID=3131927 RepID=UPI00311AF1EA
MNQDINTRLNPKVDGYIGRTSRWQRELEALRAIALDCGLTEELKWGKPCYSFQGGNVVILQGFKDSCALLFTKGALLPDPQGLLEKPGENTQGARRIPFTDVAQVAKLEGTLKQYIRDAIEVEKAGTRVDFKAIEEFPMPEELLARLDDDPALAEAFHALTPGRQRAYYLHIQGAKQSSTRAARVEKCIPQILAGKGLSDR